MLPLSLVTLCLAIPVVFSTSVCPTVTTPYTASTGTLTLTADAAGTCYNTITAPAGQMVLLTITTCSVASSGTEIDVWDDTGTYGGSYLIMAFYGTCPGTTFCVSTSSASQTMQVGYTESGTGASFSASWQFVTRPDYAVVCNFRSANSRAYLTNDHGTMHDRYQSDLCPGGSASYANNINCVTTIQAPAGHSIAVVFSAFSLGTGDYVNLYDGNTLGTYIAYLPSHSGPSTTYYSSGQYMTVLFYTDGSVTSTGWTLHWWFRPTGTPTLTSTRTPTAKAAVTATPTGTITPTRTRSRTKSVSPTETLSSTRSATRTNSLSPSRTPTRSRSFTPTRTRTVTTGTGSLSATRSATSTQSETRTGSDSCSETSTRTGTSTGSLTPSRSTTRTRSRSGTPTQTRTGTSTPSRTASITDSRTKSDTGTLTETLSTAPHLPTKTESPTDTETRTATQTPHTDTHSATPTQSQTLQTPSLGFAVLAALRALAGN